MVRSGKKSALVVLASAAVMAVTPTVAAQAAPLPIDVVACDRGDYLKVRLHQIGGREFDRCYANAGTDTLSGNMWLHRIDTGNNRVQWFGDGRWQPATPIAKWTTYVFPNHPGGVSVDKIWIE